MANVSSVTIEVGWLDVEMEPGKPILYAVDGSFYTRFQHRGHLAYYTHYMLDVQSSVTSKGVCHYDPDELRWAQDVQKWDLKACNRCGRTIPGQTGNDRRWSLCSICEYIRCYPDESSREAARRFASGVQWAHKVDTVMGIKWRPFPWHERWDRICEKTG